MSDLDVGDWKSFKVLGADLEDGRVPFSVQLAALILDNVQNDLSGVLGGINLGTVGGFDHDVAALFVVGVQVSVLVSALVGDVLSDRHAVESHVSHGDGVSIVLDLRRKNKMKVNFIDEGHSVQEFYLNITPSLV